MRVFLLSLVLLGCAPRAGVGALAVTAPVVVAGVLDGRSLLAEAATKASEAGAGPLSIVATGEASERERLGAFVEIPEASCLLGYARASRSVEDLDLAAFSDEGTPVAVDDAPDPHPTLLVCPPHPTRVYLAAVAASGEGLVAVGAQLVAPALAAAVGKAMNAHGTRVASSRAAEAWPALDDLVRRHHEELGGGAPSAQGARDGKRGWEVFRKVAVAVDARAPAVLGFPMEADGCVDALIVPDDDVGAIEVEALDERGRLVARGSARERLRSVTLCSPLAFQGTLAIRPHVGQGLVAIVLSRGRADIAESLAARPEVAWVAATETPEKAGARRDAELTKAGYGARVGAASGRLALGALYAMTPSVPVDPHPCWRFDIVGGAPLALVQASVWNESGSMLATADGANGTTVFACGSKRPRLDLMALGRPGPFLASWRPERWADVAFQEHPRAASRMLTRLASGPSGLLPGDASRVQAWTLTAGTAASWNVVVAPDSCVRVAAGGEGDGAGLTGRVVELGTGDEVDRSHGADTLLLTACAPHEAARTFVVTLVATAGKLSVVAGERVTRLQ